MSNIQMATNELHAAFQHLNKHFFQGELPEPAITIQTSGKRSTMGWCSTKEIWVDDKGLIRKYEINIAAEYLNIDFYETMDTMLHEMIHLYCKVQEIKDTSRGNAYHNKRFKEECLKRGFYYESDKPDKKLGWAFPKITEETKALIDTFPINREAFKIARNTFGQLQIAGSDDETEEERSKRSNSIKWECPSCGIIVRSTKIVHIKCGDCNETMVTEEIEEESA